MQRIMIVGGSGAGKSTLARMLGARLGLPVVHMDALFWEPGWIEADEPVFRARVAAAVAGERWVMEGNYSRTWPERLARADTVIFLDIGTPRRMWRVVRRVAVGYGRDRADLTPGCPEKVDLGFLFGWVPRYRRQGRAKALSLIAADGAAAGLARHHLHGPGAVRRFLERLDP